MTAGAERGSTYLRLSQDLKERAHTYATQHGVSLTNAIADLIEKGLTWDELNAQIVQTQSRLPTLEVENQTLRDQVNLQTQTIQGLRQTLATYQQQIQRLNQWLHFPIARCKQHCDQQATLVHIVYNQCPTGGPSPYGFELLPQFEQKTPIDVIKDFGLLVGVAGALIALASADSQSQNTDKTRR